MTTFRLQETDLFGRKATEDVGNFLRVLRTVLLFIRFRPIVSLFPSDST